MVWEQDHRIPYFCFAYIMKEKLVIVPTYNEAENIEELVADVMALDYPFDMLVVDDDSPDGTAQLVEALQTKYKDRLHLLKRQKKKAWVLLMLRHFDGHWIEIISIYLKWMLIFLMTLMT